MCVLYYRFDWIISGELNSRLLHFDQTSCSYKLQLENYCLIHVFYYIIINFSIIVLFTN